MGKWFWGQVCLLKFIIFKNLLSEKINTIDALMIGFQKSIIYKGIPIVCNGLLFSRRGTMRSMSQENTRASRLALSAVEKVYLVAYILCL